VRLLERRAVVDCAVLIDFVAAAFNKRVDKSWVSRHMRGLKFSSRRPAGLSMKYYDKNALPKAIEFVEQTRPVLKRFGDESRIVAMDQIGISDKGVLSKSWAPRGR
jgi:hypothetical protein